MKNASLLLLILFVSLILPGVAGAQVFDEVTLKDGSHVVGKVLGMVDGKLKVDTAFGGVININWSDVTELKTVGKHPFRLVDGTEVVGTATETKEGQITIVSEGIAEPSRVSLANIKAIDPPPPITYKGNFGIGASLSDGNSRDRNFSALAEFEARSERQRLTLLGLYDYAENKDSGVTKQYGKGSIKYDFFITKRLYAYAGALFEHDGFQDLNLRTVLSAGPGYQIIDKGDFTSDWTKEMQLYAEAGLAYYSEDYKRDDDSSYLAARWAVKFDWPFLEKKITIFHRHEGYPGLEDADDLYISTEQGVRFAIWQSFVATIQVNWRWDNTPSEGTKRADTLYLFTLGWSFVL